MTVKINVKRIKHTLLVLCFSICVLIALVKSLSFLLLAFHAGPDHAPSSMSAVEVADGVSKVVLQEGHGALPTKGASMTLHCTGP